MRSSSIDLIDLSFTSPPRWFKTRREPSISVFLPNWIFCSFGPLAIMAEAPVDVLLKGNSGRNTRGLLRIIILATIAAAAVSSRLFSVIRMF